MINRQLLMVCVVLCAAVLALLWINIKQSMELEDCKPSSPATGIEAKVERMERDILILQAQNLDQDKELYYHWLTFKAMGVKVEREEE